MTKLRDKIKKIVDELPEDSLQDLLVYLEKNDNDITKKKNLMQNLDKILLEDKGLLERVHKI